jgi:hypothetical protein
MINLQLGIYDRSGNKLSSAFLEALTGAKHFDMSDPQVIWDPSSNRFYYVILDTKDDNMFWGFSKGANPTTIPADFCNYKTDFGWGMNLPDYPKLGQTTDFLLIGVNLYANLATYLGSDVAWLSKPASGTISTCPLESTFKRGKQTALQDCLSPLSPLIFAATPEPAVQTDPSGEGWIVANPDPTNSGFPSTRLDLFKVTRNLDGTANIQAKGDCVPVAAFAPPVPAVQKGGVHTLDTLDARLPHAVSAKDPSHGGALAVWTSHTVLGGAGAEVRWYEIDVANKTLFQSGLVSDPNLFVFNGGISPDRAVSGSSASFGSNMVLGVSTSGVNDYPAVQMVSKIGANPQSPLVLVKQSPGPEEGFDCFELGKCRWGDYSGAAPDPIAPAGAPFGKVWLSNMWASGAVDPLSATWRTWNWAATPAPLTSPPPPCQEADGNGDMEGGGNFQFDQDGCLDGDQDSVQYRDTAAGVDYRSTAIQSVQIDNVAHSLTVIGSGTNAGVPVSFMMVAVEATLVTPGWFSITLSNGYSKAGNLIRGTILLH